MIKQQLQIHLDVNKTILVDDKVQGLDIKTSCEHILFWTAWGHVSGDGHWSWDGQNPGIVQRDPSAMLYGDFVMRRGGPRRHRIELKRRFLEPDQPGARVKPIWREMIAKLELPPEIIEAVRELSWSRRAGLDRHIRLLPCFFRLLKYIEANAPDATVVLRTFGSDIPEVMEELNGFCRGEHPLYGGVSMTGGGGGFDGRVRPSSIDQYGSLHRGGSSGDDPDALSLALGVLDNPPGRDKPPYPCPLSFFRSKADRLVESMDAVWEYIDSYRGRVLAFRDDYAFWARHGFKASSGKLLLVSEGPGRELFFDDNILYRRPHIVDARSLKTKLPLEYEETRGRNLIPVDPYAAIMNEDYFVEQLEKAVRCDVL